MTKKLFIYLLLIIILLPTQTCMTLYGKTSSPTIQGSSGIVIDASTGTIIYSKNPYTTHYPASITKLMTALLTFESLDLNQNITFSESAISSIPIDTSRIGIQPDEVLTVDQALHGMLLMSANEVAAGLAEAISGSISGFAEAMNEKAALLGAKNTHFTNPHGLHDPDHYTTAYDMALITKELLKYPEFLSIMEDITYQIPPTNKVDEIRYLSQQHHLMNNIKDATAYREDVIGGKTGYTSEANNTLVTIAKQGDTTLIVVILDAPSQWVYDDTNTLLDYGFETFETIPMPSVEVTDTLPIITEDTTGSEEIGKATIAFKSDSLSKLTINKSWDVNDITYTLNLPDSLSDQTTSGEIIGSLSYYYQEELIGTRELVVNEIHLTLPSSQPVTSSSLKIINNKSLLNFFIFMPITFCIVYLLLFKRKRRRYKDFIQERRGY